MAEQGTSGRAPEEEGRPTRSTATLFVAAVVIGLVLVLGAVLTYVFTRDDTTATGTAPTTSVVAAPTSVAVATPAQGGSTGLTEAPAGTRWELYQGVVLPYSPTAGPKTVDGLGVASGYTHDAAGALFASLQIDTRRFLAPDDLSRNVVDTQIVAGEGRDAWIAYRTTINIAPNSVPSTQLAQVAGFKVSNYTDTVATISVARKGTSGGLQAADFTVTWVDGDWKLVLLPSGSSATSYVVTDLEGAGYIPWSGV